MKLANITQEPCMLSGNRTTTLTFISTDIDEVSYAVNHKNENFKVRTYEDDSKLTVVATRSSGKTIAAETYMRPWTGKNPFLTNTFNTSVTPTKVIFNNPATIVYWADGTKTVVKRQKGDRWDKEKGLAMAIAKKALGNKGNYCKIFDKWLCMDTDELKRKI